MSFVDYCSELIGTIPRLPYPLAATLINRAWSDIRNKRLWSFLVGSADIIAPSLISAGTVTFTQGSNIGTLDTTASTAFNLVGIGNAPIPPIAGDIGLGYQIRTGSNTGLLATTSAIYSILQFDGNVTITLDRVWSGSTGNYSYQAFKCYYAAPVTDFLRYFSIINTVSNYSITGKNLYREQEWLNGFDPQRGSSGDPFLISTYTNINGLPVHEWYPYPSNFTLFTAYFVRRGTDLSPTVDLPTNFPVDVLLTRAYMHAADWALAAVATFPELGNTNWVQFRAIKEKYFNDIYNDAVRNDAELFPRLPKFPSHHPFPLGGQFLQSHDVSGFLGGGG